MKNLVRIILCALFIIIFVVLGILGFIGKRQIVKDNKTMLDNIANIFNNNQTILEYQKTGVNVKASTTSTTFNIVFDTGTKILINLTLKRIMLKLISIKMIIRQV